VRHPILRAIGAFLLLLVCPPSSARGDAEPPASAAEQVWLELTAPEPAQELQSPISLLEVRGRAGMGARTPLDLVLLLDMSESTLYPSGLDVDGDGVRGELAKGGVRSASGAYRPHHRWTTDVDDTIVSAERTAALRLLDRLESGRTRVGLVVFAGRPQIIEPVGDLSRARQALEEMRPRIDTSGTNLGSAVRTALGLLARAAPETELPRRQVIIVLSDGQPTVPIPEFNAKRYAFAAARRAREQHARIYTFGLSPDYGAPNVLEKMAHATGGEHVPFARLGDIVEDLPHRDLAGVASVRIVNRTTGSTGRAVRLFADGSFDGFVELAAGENVLEVQARSASGVEANEERIVRYEPSPASPDEDAVEELGRLLRVRTLETELAARAQEVREERIRRLKVEAADE
jgi:hypothetical protein